jgi:hypothetical protein
MQQIVKLAAAAESGADVVLLADSDVEFIRLFTPDMFVRNGVVRFYREPKAVDERLPRHVIWHRNARTLLGLPAAAPPFDDYIASMIACDPRLVRRMLHRVTTVTGRPWPGAIAAQLHFSEWILYGVFVDEILPPESSSFASDDSRCRSYWHETPLDADEAADFAGTVRPSDIAVMISAKSNTPLAARRAALAQYAPQLDPPSIR